MPVFGLRPVRAERDLTEKVPKPTKETHSPLVRELLIALVAAFNIRFAAAFGTSASSEIASIRSLLFNLNSLFLICIESVFKIHSIDG